MLTRYTISQHGTPLPKFSAVLFIVPLVVSCKALVPTSEEKVVIKVLDSVMYPFQEITNKNGSKPFSDLLEEKDIALLADWRKSASILENLLQSECAGCSNKTANLKPLYKAEKGKFIHYGLQNEIGIENWVFKKNGRFLTRFYMFQGETQEKINEELKDIQNIDYVLESVYPSQINTKNVYLEHVSYTHNVDADNQWYETIYPTKIGYAIDLGQKNPVLRFKFEGGLYSYQRPNKNGENEIVNFVQPLLYANAVAIDEPQSYSSFTDAFYGNATFFLLDLEEHSEVLIRLESKIKDLDFRFSVLENNGFFTMEEYLTAKEKLYGQYREKLEKGGYLIRVIHENADYMDSPLYTIKVTITNMR
jgi:hypothetical protein